MFNLILPVFLLVLSLVISVCANYFLQPEVPTTQMIKGIQFIYYDTHTFTPSDTEEIQTIDLRQFGIKIHIPPNSFSESMLHITVGVGTSENVIIPENMSLASAIYYVKPSSKLLKPVTVEMEHCVALKGKSTLSHLTFSKASNSAPPPYVFNKVSNGTFAPGQSWGTIQMSEFSVNGITVDNTLQKTYMASVISQQSNKYRYQIQLIAGQDLSATRKIIQGEYHDWTRIVPWFQFEFIEESTKIILDVKKEGVLSGNWKLRPLASPEIHKRAIDSLYGSCTLSAKWTSKDETEDLEHTIDLQGITTGYVYIEIWKDQLQQQPTLIEESSEIKFNELYQELAEIGDWEGLCLVLNVDTAAEEAIRYSTEVKDKKGACLRSYYNKGEVTWKGVIAAIAKHPIKNCRVANNIARKYGITNNPCPT